MMLVVAVEMGYAAWCKSDFGIAECVGSIDLDKTLHESVLPNRMARAFYYGSAVIASLWLIPILSQMKKLDGVAADHLVLLVFWHAGEVALNHAH